MNRNLSWSLLQNQNENQKKKKKNMEPTKL